MASPRSVWGNSLRNALLRHQRAYISLAASPPATARRMAEPSTAAHPATGERVAAATPASRSFVLASLRALHLDPGDPAACSTTTRRRTTGSARPNTNPPHHHRHAYQA